MFGRQIDRYVLGALLPYIGLSLLILTAVLLTQQASKFAEVLGGTDAPLRLVSEVLLNLLPNILVFSIPMSVLTGVATGFSRLGSDSELVAMRAAGIGTWRILSPALFLGVLVCAATLYTGFVWAPAASRNLSEVALRAALRKLESPVEPRSFYTGMPGKVVYVRDGDRERGQWGRVFIHWQEPDGQVRLVTAAVGRLDTSGEQTELVLEDAVVTSLRQPGEQGGMTTEHSAGLRIRDDRLNQNRILLIKKIREREPELDELGWGDLRAKGRGSDKETDKATMALHRRLSMCLAPLAFVLLGGSFGLKIGRGGKSIGVLSSLVALVLYYLLALLGEQLWRAGHIPPVPGAWLAFGVSVLAGAALILSYRRHFTLPPPWRGRVPAATAAQAPALSHMGPHRRLKFLGLLDRGIISALLRNFLLVLSALIAVFFIFTLFELLRFISVGRSGLWLVLQYLFFLLPFVYVVVTPVSMLLSVLITFALMARRSEAIAWWAGGQSVYRLLVPSFLCAGAVGLALWGVQERLMPQANLRQNALRSQIRSGGARSEPQTGRVWAASGDTRRIYAYGPATDGGVAFSDPLIYEFDEEALHLRRIVWGRRGALAEGGRLEVDEATVVALGGAELARGWQKRLVLGVSDPEVFKYELNRPSELDSKDLSAYIKTLKRSDANVQALSVALERKRAEPFSPLVMALVGAPLALAFGRRSAVTALCAAVFIALTFLGVNSGLQQIGAGGLLPPYVAAWSPIFIFAALGLYFLTRART